MTARRQSSTTSLSKYARANSPDLSNRSLDFCNAFWGVGDGGVDVLFARMRGAARTMDELRSFWKERAAIEEEYAKKLARLAKTTLGKDEIGELRNSLDTIRLETNKQAGFHLQLSQQIHNDLEGQTATFYAKQQHHKKTYQAAIEKEWKVKQTREGYALKAREKYESDCRRINSYTAQSTLLQGKELEKVRLKLERAQQTIPLNENDYMQFTSALHDTMRKWEMDWKTFCDSCQDLEEERLEFMKDNMWAYANAVSTVCVSDDQCCEEMRLALEQLEPEKDMENFVRDYGTGSDIPEPPPFVNYANTDAIPPSSSQHVTRPAVFTRSSQRTGARLPPPSQQEPEDDLTLNRAGVGAGGQRSDTLPDTGLQRRGTQSNRNGRTSTQQTNSTPAPAGTAAANGHYADTQRPPSAASAQRPNYDQQTEPVDPTVNNTMLVVGDNAYPVDPMRDPQQQKGPTTRMSPPATGANDPLKKQMEELKSAAANGNGRRHSIRKDPPSMGQPPSRNGTIDQTLGAPPPINNVNSGSINGPSANAYRNSAEIVVGSWPLVSSRSTSPNPPTAVLAAPPPTSQPPSEVPVEAVLDSYAQSFPGETRSRSRANSYRDSVVAPPTTTSVTDLNGRPTSRQGYPGIGRHDLVPISMNTSPAQQHGVYQQQPQNNSVGIALGPDGRVVQDRMANQLTPLNQPHIYTVQPDMRAQQKKEYNPVPPRQPVQQISPPPPVIYQQPPYAPPPQQSPVRYNSAPVPYTAPPQTPYGHSGSYGAPPVVSPLVNRSYTYNTVQAPPNHPYGNYNHELYRPPSPVVNRSPSPPPSHVPPPTGAYTDDGRPILFYVKALYDYNATIDEEFDFQAGDIIAVTATPEDGWWSGELLDEARRQASRHVFPSNFVALF